MTHLRNEHLATELAAADTLLHARAERGQHGRVIGGQETDHPDVLARMRLRFSCQQVERQRLGQCGATRTALVSWLAKQVSKLVS